MPKPSSPPSSASTPKTGGLSVMAKVKKNWQEAKNPANGFKQIAKLGPIGIMAKVEKNWQDVKKPENQFKQIAKLGPIGVMAKIEKNWEQVKHPDSGFKHLAGAKPPPVHRQEEIEMSEIKPKSGQSRQRAQSLDDSSIQRKSGSNSGDDDVASQLAKRRRSYSF